MRTRLSHARPASTLLIALLAPLVAMLPAVAFERSAPKTTAPAIVPIPLEHPDIAPPKPRPKPRPAAPVRVASAAPVSVIPVVHVKRSTPALRVGFQWPVAKSTITSPFGVRPFVAWPGMPAGPHPKTQFHHGDDISCAVNQPVGAAKDGTVIMSGTDADYGNFIVIAHPGGWSTLYGHLNVRVAPVGRRVHQGQLIGLCGMTGHATGPHVHFEIRHDGSFLNPIRFLP